MKTIDQIIQETVSCVHNGRIYLIESISEKAGLFCSDGDILYLVKNHEGCTSLSIATEYLHMDTNVFIQSFEEQRSFPDGEYNVLRYKGDFIREHEDNVDSFVNLCIAHAKLLNGESFEQFFYSLISLFQLPREQNYLNLIGLVGELSVISYVYHHFRVDISPYWHLGGAYAKYDFSIPGRLAIEVKSSSKGDKEVSIKHSQLFTDAASVCVAVVHVSEDSTGNSLEEILQSIRNTEGLCNNLQFELSLQKELKRVSHDQMRIKRFIISSIRFFDNRSINPFPIVPDNISSLEYDLDLSELPSLDDSSLISYLPVNK